VRERERARSWQDCLGSHPSLVSTSYRTRRIIGGERCQQGREKGGQLGLPLGRFAKREREEKRREEEEEKKNLAEIHLNFEKFKIWSKWWW
jgi:hypothetical protein